MGEGGPRTRPDAETGRCDQGTAQQGRRRERVRRFELEAQAAAALDHPNVMSIFHVGYYHGLRNIVTELLQRRDVARPFAERSHPSAGKCWICSQE